MSLDTNPRVLVPIGSGRPWPRTGRPLPFVDWRRAGADTLTGHCAHPALRRGTAGPGTMRTNQGFSLQLLHSVLAQNLRTALRRDPDQNPVVGSDSGKVRSLFWSTELLCHPGLPMASPRFPRCRHQGGHLQPPLHGPEQRFSRSQPDSVIGRVSRKEAHGPCHAVLGCLQGTSGLRLFFENVQLLNNGKYATHPS